MEDATPSSQRYFLVTGGSGGIGAATCSALAAAGFSPLVAFVHNETRAREVATHCGGIPLHLDLSDDTSIDNAVEWITKTGMPLAGIVHAASPALELLPLAKLSSDAFAREWRVNVAGPQRLICGLIQRCLRKHRSGVVVGVLSAAMGNHGVAELRNMGAYLIAKYGQEGLLAVLAAEHPWLRVRSVRPSYTETRMLDAFDERFLALQREREPFKTPEQVAQMILQEIAAQ